MLIRVAILVVIALFVLPISAHAAISFVASDTANSTGAQEITVNVPSGTQDDDVMIATCIKDDNESGSNFTSAGWTQVYNHPEDEGRDITTTILYRVASSEPANYTFDTGIGNNEEVSCMIHTYRGVDTSNVLDVTFIDVEDTGHFTTGSNDVTAPNRPITTVTNDAWVIVVHFASHDDITSVGAPTNYTIRNSLTGGSMDHRQQALADREISSAGLESPGDWTHSCSTCNQQEYTTSVIALRPAAAGDTTAPDDVSDLSSTSKGETTVTLSWTAPGDDGSTGTATSYDIRYSTSNITDLTWAAATQVSGEPSPSIAGSTESFQVTGLTANTQYFFGIKTSDEVPNESGLSNVHSTTTDAVADTTAPNDVSDLDSSLVSPTAVTLSWTAPGDDGSSGTATSYDVRYSTSNITEGNWSSATQASGEPSPSVAGSSESFQVTGLTQNTAYFFGIKTSDEVPNESGLSNVHSTTTTSTADTTAPAAVSDLALSGETSTTVDLDWTAPGDDGSTGTATTYDIRYSTSEITAGNFSSATQVSGEPSPSVAGTSESMTVTGLTASTQYWFAMKTDDEVPNTSAISNIPNTTTSAPPADSTAPSAVTDLAASNPNSNSVDISWTAPGDDGSTGTATSYDVRYSTSEITAANFSSADEASGEPSPSVAGTFETMTVSGLSAETLYYFAIKATDDAGNTATISNVVSKATEAASALTIPENGGGSAPRQILVTGQAFPAARMELLQRSEQAEDFKVVPLKDTTITPEGAFTAQYLGLVGGDYFVGLRFTDPAGRTTGLLSFAIDFTKNFDDQFVIEDIFVPPTVGFKRTIITRDQDVEIEGYAASGSTVELKLGGNVIGETTADSSGKWSFTHDARNLLLGRHQVSARQIHETHGTSSLAFPKSFTISNLLNPDADFNGDGKINITDWSQFLFRWGSLVESIRNRVDLDKNGIVNIFDLSIFLRAFQ